MSTLRKLTNSGPIDLEKAAIVAMSITISERQKQLGLTSLQVAKKAHISIHSYRRFIEGSMIPKLDIFLRILHAVDLTIELEEIIQPLEKVFDV